MASKFLSRILPIPFNEGVNDFYEDCILILKVLKARVKQNNETRDTHSRFGVLWLLKI